MTRNTLKRNIKRALTHHIPLGREYDIMRQVAFNLAEDLANTIADYVTARQVRSIIPPATYSVGVTPSVVPAPTPVTITGQVQE